MVSPYGSISVVSTGAQLLPETKTIYIGAPIRSRMSIEDYLRHLSLYSWAQTLLPDFVLAFAFFTALSYAVLGKRFGNQRPAVTMSAALGLALAAGLVWWERQNELSVRNLGPIAVGFAVMVLALVIYQSVRQVGGSWAGAGIALGASILVASLLGLKWSMDPGIVQTVTTVALIVGLLAFLMHHRDHAVFSPARLQQADARHDMSDLYQNRHVSGRITNRLRRLKKQAKTLRDHPEQTDTMVAQLQRLLPAEGWLTERMARLRAKVHRIRKGHLARLDETSGAFAGLPRSEMKRVAAEMVNSYQKLTGMDARLERLDAAVAAYEKRVITLTQMAQRYAQHGDRKKLPGLLKEAEELQRHNSRLCEIIMQTENKLTSLLQKVAAQARQVKKA